MAVSLVKQVYQTYLKINCSLAFTKNVKGLHLFTMQIPPPSDFKGIKNDAFFFEVQKAINPK